MEFTHYEIELRNNGQTMVGRPNNPYPVAHQEYFEFETFAKENEFYCTTCCKPGLIAKAWIYPMRCDVFDVSALDFSNELPVKIHHDVNDYDNTNGYWYYVYDTQDKVLSIPCTILVN